MQETGFLFRLRLRSESFAFRVFGVFRGLYILSRFLLCALGVLAVSNFYLRNPWLKNETAPDDGPALSVNFPQRGSVVRTAAIYNVDEQHADDVL
jgi:hypothetical protein